jgi:hypothetical protein
MASGWEFRIGIPGRNRDAFDYLNQEGIIDAAGILAKTGAVKRP